MALPGCQPENCRRGNRLSRRHALAHANTRQPLFGSAESGMCVPSTWSCVTAGYPTSLDRTVCTSSICLTTLSHLTCYFLPALPNDGPFKVLNERLKLYLYTVLFTGSL